MSGIPDTMYAVPDIEKVLAVFKSFAFIATPAVIGAILAVLSVRLNTPTGWIGGISLIVWAILARRNWEIAQKQTGLEPSSPERILRLRAAGTALLLGHLIAALAHPELDMHVGQGNSLAIDSWTMFAALIFVGFLFRQDGTIRDERDQSISAKGNKFGYVSLIGILTVLLFLLGFLPPRVLDGLKYFTLANILVATILLSVTIKYSVQLIGYAKDTEAVRAAELEQ